MQITKCFELLQVESDAPWQVVKKSYYSLCKKLHPDLNYASPDAETRLKEINQAFQVLKSHFGNQVSTSLAKEDRTLNNWKNFFQKIQKNPNFKKIKDSCMDYLSRLDGSIFHLNIHKTIQIPVSTAKKGGSIFMKSGKEKFEVKIPSGDWSRLSVSIPGKGQSSLFSNKRGDFILDLHLPKIGVVTPKAFSFSYEMAIDRTKLGQVMSLNSSEGPIKFVLPRNTIDGQTFYLRSHLDSKHMHILTIRLN
tara:strand:- start:89 stop:838 length:750 start_codon:yes stop_codon:yes gene_type:complete